MKQRLTITLITVSALMLMGLTLFHTIFILPADRQVYSLSNQESQVSLHCYQNPQAPALDKEGQLNVLVWNIYKQNRPSWQSALREFSDNKQLVLLQEASMGEAFKQYIEQARWFGTQVDAFKVFDTSAGVLNLTLGAPRLACAYTELEPWLRLPKSALYARYPLSDGRELAVVNIHAVNFTYGTQEYLRQIDTLVTELRKHQGPMLVAGDFNSWSEERMTVMRQALSGLALNAVTFTPDNRTQFLTGLQLDHIFYRGLTLKTAEAPHSDASDHNPMLANFELKK